MLWYGGVTNAFLKWAEPAPAQLFDGRLSTHCYLISCSPLMCFVRTAVGTLHVYTAPAPCKRPVRKRPISFSCIYIPSRAQDTYLNVNHLGIFFDSRYVKNKQTNYEIRELQHGHARKAQTSAAAMGMEWSTGCAEQHGREGTSPVHPDPTQRVHLGDPGVWEPNLGSQKSHESSCGKGCTSRKHFLWIVFKVELNANRLADQKVSATPEYSMSITSSKKL